MTNQTNEKQIRGVSVDDALRIAREMHRLKAAQFAYDGESIQAVFHAPETMHRATDDDYTHSSGG